MKTQPPCATVLKWLRANLGKTDGTSLGALTGTDHRALQAAVQIVQLYSYDPEPALLDAFRQVVNVMQEHTKQFAYHAIAQVMNWDDRERVWNEARLPLPQGYNRRCSFEV